MKPYIYFYPSPRRSRRSRWAIATIAIYAASGFITLGVIAITYTILR